MKPPRIYAKECKKVTVFGNSDTCMIRNEKHNLELTERISFINDSCHDYNPYKAPPKVFEKECNLTGISRNWKIPFKLTPKKMEDVLTSIFTLWNKNWMNEILYHDFIKILSEFIKLNPEILNIKGDDEYMWQILIGMTSCFNYEDIRYWTEELSYNDYKDNEEHKKKHERILDLIKAKGFVKEPRFGWRPSMRTLDIVLGQLT